MGRMIDLTGMRYGRLTVLNREGSWYNEYGEGGFPKWRCRCDCGRETVVIGRNLKSGMTRSCGCLKKERCGRRKKILLLE